MKKMMSVMVLLFVMCAMQASAQVVISQVLYDPIETESGGEAVELQNQGDVSIDISGWVIQTENSAKDATIPQNTILDAGETFLVADEGWAENKDKDAWRQANYEEKITIGNQNSGIALLDAQGVSRDALGWGNMSDKALYKGSPAKMVDAGTSLLRVQTTGDNSKDFVQSEANFDEGIPVALSADVKSSKPRIIVSQSVSISPEGMLSIKNAGDAPARVKIVLSDLAYKNQTISKNAIVIDGPLEFVIQPFEEHKTRISLTAPKNVIAGKYTGTLRVIGLSGS